MGATTASEAIEISACPPDHIERRNVPNQLAATDVMSPNERSASRRPSPTILPSQGRLGSVVRVCSLLRYKGRLSMKYESSLTIVGIVKTIKTAMATTTIPMMASVAGRRLMPSRSMRLTTGLQIGEHHAGNKRQESASQQDDDCNDRR